MTRDVREEIHIYAGAEPISDYDLICLNTRYQTIKDSPIEISIFPKTASEWFVALLKQFPAIISRFNALRDENARLRTEVALLKIDLEKMKNKYRYS